MIFTYQRLIIRIFLYLCTRILKMRTVSRMAKVCASWYKKRMMVLIGII
jgi:hypothetical protein